MAENQNSQQATLDEVESHVPQQLHPILEAAFKYHKQLIAGVVAIVAIAAIYAGMTTYNQRALATAQTELGDILVKSAGDERIAKLEALLGSAPSSAKPAILLALAQSSMNNEKYDKAVGYWNQLAGTADDDMQFVARLGKAKSLTLAGKGKESMALLKELVGIAPEAFTVSTYRQLAVAAEAAGDKNEALTAYKKLAEMPVPDKPFIDYKVAQLEAK